MKSQCINSRHADRFPRQLSTLESWLSEIKGDAPEVIPVAVHISVPTASIPYLHITVLKQKATLQSVLNYLMTTDGVMDAVTNLSNVDEPIPEIYGTALQQPAPRLHGN